MSNLYLAERLKLSTANVGDQVILEGAEARHATTVVRIRQGEQIAVGDGRGWVANTEVLNVNQKSVSLRVRNVRFQAPATPAIVLVQALAKGDRDERAVQSATELGVDRIIPWQASRSIARWIGQKSTDDKAAKGRARWATITREATKQSARAWVPEVEQVASTTQLAEKLSGCRTLVLSPTANERLAGLKPDALGAIQSIAIIVGPEGGIAPEEVAEFEAVGALPVRLGGSVLRTSTAGPAAIAALNVLLGRW